MPAGNCKLQTLRQYYRLPERGAHTALGDVLTVVDLFSHVLRPIARQRGLETWEAIAAYAGEEWYPSRIAFGKHDSAPFTERRECDLRSIFNRLTESERALYVMACPRRPPTIIPNAFRIRRARACSLASVAV